jgi:hypothetical protein
MSIAQNHHLGNIGKKVGKVKHEIIFRCVQCYLEMYYEDMVVYTHRFFL